MNVQGGDKQGELTSRKAKWATHCRPMINR